MSASVDAIVKAQWKMGWTLQVVREIYAESYALLEELGVAVIAQRSGVEPLPWLTWEPTDGQTSDSCVRSRLAKWFLPAGSLVGGNRRDEAGDQGERHHIRLAKRGSGLLFTTIEFYNSESDDLVPTPLVLYGSVSGFSGRFESKVGDTVQIQRGDLASILASMDLRQKGSRQEVHGKVRQKTATMLMRIESPLAAFRTGQDIDSLAKAIVSVHKDPVAFERGQ